MPSVTASRPAHRHRERGKQRSASFRADIEGLRAIAVTSVLIYHLNSSWLPGGFAGVDIFFVISGYLITSHLLREWESTGSVSLRRFYARRMVRLVPAATLALAGTLTATVMFVPRYLWQQIGIDIAGAAGYVVNWLFAARSVDYLAEDSVASPVQHFWSLAVEEQYYLIWPLLLIATGFLARQIGARARVVMAVVAVFVIVLSFGAALTAASVEDPTSYFSTLTRLWELAAGALVALLMSKLTLAMHAAVSRLGYAIGLVLIFVSIVTITGDTLWPGVATLLPVLGTVFAIMFGTGTRLARIISVAPLVWLGGISYSLYLWHWPIITIGGYVADPGTLRFAVLATLLSVVLAWLSVSFFENPIRFAPLMKSRARNGLALGLSFGAVSIIAGLLLSMSASSGSLVAPANAQPRGAVVLGGSPSTIALSELNEQPEWVLPSPLDAPKDVPRLYDDGCQQDQASAKVLTCIYGDKTAARTIAVVGDSKANQWLPAISRIGSEEGYKVVVMTKSACTYADSPAGLSSGGYESCDAWIHNIDKNLKELDPDVVMTSMVRSKAYVKGTDEQQRSALVDGLATKLRMLDSSGAQVIVLGDSLHPPGPGYQCVAEHSTHISECGFPLNQALEASALDVQRRAVESIGGDIVDSASHVSAMTASRGVPSLIDMTDYICPPAAAAACPAVIGNALIYRQGSHLTATYVETLTDALRSRMAIVGIDFQ